MLEVHCIDKCVWSFCELFVILLQKKLPPKPKQPGGGLLSSEFIDYDFCLIEIADKIK